MQMKRKLFIDPDCSLSVPIPLDTAESDKKLVVRSGNELGYCIIYNYPYKLNKFIFSCTD